MFVVAMPSMGMSVLSKEISTALDLSLVQVGFIWGIGSLPGIFTSLLGGVLGDKFGPKRVLVVFSLAGGLLGAARGLAPDFLSLAVVVVLSGALMPFVMMNGVKTIGQWFPPSQLGMASGLISMGMALGFLLGAMFSASVLSPWLGGWRQVFMFYGLTGALLSIPWFFSRTFPTVQPEVGQSKSIKNTIWHVASLKNIWLMGMTLFCVGGCIQSMLGYLPLYLRNQGWNPIQADAALSAFHLVSLVFVLPIALWSDRLGSRKRLLMLAALMEVLGVGLLSFATGSLVWVAVLMAGFVRDAFMAIFVTKVVETKGVGPVYAGTAFGITTTISSLGMVIAPPLGNSLAIFWPGAPFAFWSILALLGIIFLSMVKNKVPVSPPGVLENA
jgi:MFS family permease